MENIVEIVNRYFDGSLQQHEEKWLFDELAISQYTRNVFNQYLRLHLSASKDTTSLMPPIEATENVFRSLGFSIPSNMSDDSKKLFPKTLSGFAISLLVLFFTCFISAATLGIYKLVTGDNVAAGDSIAKFSQNIIDENVLFSTAAIKKDKNNLEITEGIIKNNSEYSSQRVNTGSAKAENPNSAGKVRQNIQSLAYHQALPEMYASNMLSNSEDDYEKKLINLSNNNQLKKNSVNDITAKNIDKSTNDISALSNSLIPNNNIFSNNNLLINDINTTKFILLLNKSFFAKMPTYNIDENNAFWNNIDFSISYKLSNRHTIGVEFGWEDYAQEFDRTINGEAFTQQQIPTLFYGSAIYSYNLAPILSLEAVEPFAKFSVGGTSIGPVIGSSLGAYIKLYGNFGLSISENFNLLFYNVENNLYNSNKLETRFGIFYGF